ncbi:ABC transporter ATP-binding protein [Ruminiclostridium herbifermentans]|uniref:ABC transporter ATP-binding protein n=1 Tax=Ruminiclostridium herbifermentans TaxID=2488810 RepID=A0A4U7JLR3_9FIRM|nr:ABC transporter ATP-binding protein [Ruminiclostridium herbifermentans]QNU66198.1 ABC transporter ATP-binding protein [Ruminiclostridium herbifermentans]
MCILRVENLIKDYTMEGFNIQALKGINLHIESGEFVSIMGPSGSGKSTLLYLLGSLEHPSSGKIILADKDISTLNDNEISKIRRREIGFIFQFYNLIPVLNVEENIMMPITLDGGKFSDYKEQLDKVIEIVGLTDRRKHRPSQLSGGQQQRVAIARALINNPKIILADEPTGNLDTKTSNDIMKLLKELCEKYGKTIVMVTHDVKTAEFASRIIHIKDGVIEKEVNNYKL